MAVAAVLALAASSPTTKPNIVWFLTDDQDQLLGASFPLTSEATPMPQTKRLMQDMGVYAENWYIHTPICSPSRSELLTGKYFHNIKMTGSTVMHVNYTKVHDHTFVRVLKEQAGYATGLFGKYTNQMPSHVPIGFDAWMANAGGNYGGPQFQTLNIDGLPDGSYTFPQENYSTSVIGNVSIAWIRKVAAEGKPFMAYIAPKAAHEPFIPPSWYIDHWDESWPETEPRGASWNCSAEARSNHHGFIAKNPMITDEAARVITGVFRNRWRTLMAVDDLIAGVFAAVEDLGLMNNTYFLYSSDHGFQLGQLNIMMDKRQMYEWDTKIHLLARGPGIKPGSSFKQPGTQVDIAPTLLGLAGIAAPVDMDGRSIVPFIVDSSQMDGVPTVLKSTGEHLLMLGDARAYTDNWRDEVFIEYYYNAYNTKCATGNTSNSPHNYPKHDSWCATLSNNTDCWSSPGGSSHSDECYTTEDPSNNFIALRRFEDGRGTMYAEFQNGNLNNNDIEFDAIDFVEHYHVVKDPEMLNNLAIDPAGKVERQELSDRLRVWLSCAGATCPPVASQLLAV